MCCSQFYVFDDEMQDACIKWTGDTLPATAAPNSSGYRLTESRAVHSNKFFPDPELQMEEILVT